MNKKATKRISLLAALLLACTMLLTAFALLAGGKARAFADGADANLLYIVDAGRVDSTSGGKLTYGYDPATSSPSYVGSTTTFIKRNDGTFGDITDYNGKPLTRLLNSYTDHPFGEDPSGKYWGFIDDYSEDMPHRLGRAGEFAAGYSEFRSVNDDGVTNELLVYKFEVLGNNALDVTVMTHAPDGWGTVNGKMSVNGGDAISLVADGSDRNLSVPGCEGVLDDSDGRHYLTLTFGVDGAKTVVNGIIIRNKPNEYNVFYNLDGGTNNVANTATYTAGTGLTLADPTRTGYTFDGWYDAESGGNKMTAISDTETGGVTLYARWSVATYEITYNLDGGVNDAANKATYTYGEGFTLADPTREGCIFVGWYDAEHGGNEVTEISDVQAGNVTLYARWNGPTYTVSYVLGGGTNNAANEATYTYGTGLTLADPTRTGYVFDGWYDAGQGGNKVTGISDTQTGDVTLYARWSAATYTVTYNLGGGTNAAANKATYTYGVGLTLAEPTRTGYTFDGWYDAENGGNKVTAISDTQAGNVTLYARWTQNAAENTAEEGATKKGCNSSIGGTAPLLIGLLLLAAGAIVTRKCKKKN
ncbi:MAG: InlB B-repeat-containing protein [Clostridiales bacterium]|nr:InlB B-repeat-containing protein [Clostridiales bacterium]